MKILQSNKESKESKKARKDNKPVFNTSPKKEIFLGIPNDIDMKEVTKDYHQNRIRNKICICCSKIICDGSNTHIPNSGGCKCGQK